MAVERALRSNVGVLLKSWGMRRGLMNLSQVTPSLTVVQSLLSVAAEQDLSIMSLDVTHAFLQQAMTCNEYIELRRHDDKTHDMGTVVHWASCRMQFTGLEAALESEPTVEAQGGDGWLA